jgi:cell division protein FtsL
MNRTRFVKVAFALLTVFVFLKIYQHNKIVKLVYAKQRIDKEKRKLGKDRDSLLVELYKLQDQERVVVKAESTLGMRPLKLSQTMTFT